MTKLTVVHTEPQSDNEIHITQIDTVVKNAIDHLVVGDSLDYIENRLAGLKLLVSKLRYDGIIEVSGVDIFALARTIHMASQSLPMINQILYSGRQSIDSLRGILDVFKQYGLEIQIKQLNDDYIYYVKAKRCFPQS